MDWSRESAGWNGWLAPADYPLVINPPEGRLWNGNSRMIDGDLLQKLGDGGYELGARARQIHDGLYTRNHFSPSDLQAIQLDNRALLLTRWKQLLDETLQTSPASPRRNEIQQALSDWDGHASVQSVAYRIVRNFRLEVMKHLLGGFIAKVKQDYPEFEMPRLSQAEHAVWQLLEQRPLHLLPASDTDWDSMLAARANRIAEQMQAQPGGLAARTWGEENTADIRHPVSRALPAWIATWLNMPSDPLPGDHHMPRVQAPNFGASLRFVVAPGEEDKGYFEMPGGQSGHPLSPYYGSGHADWVAGKHVPFLPGATQQMLYLHPAETIQ